MPNMREPGYYRKKNLQKLAPWEPTLIMDGISVSEADKANGSPKDGDMIAFNPKDGTDRWLVAAKFVDDNYEFVGSDETACS